MVGQIQASAGTVNVALINQRLNSKRHPSERRTALSELWIHHQIAGTLVSALFFS